MACDIRYCTEDAFFSVKEVDLAITGDLGMLQRLPGIVEYGKAVELALTSWRFSALEAKSMGLISTVFRSKTEMASSGSANSETLKICNNGVFWVGKFGSGAPTLYIFANCFGSSSGEGQANGTAGMSSLATQESFTLPRSNKPVDEVWKEIAASVSTQQ
ncbi:PREDICTED: uncharacterized protein LOC104601029 [Nelumbo nucifera]|uniref:Uncharacterized protein LOC104601029 n=1 Tax=Nelumbo nucifera TaxID=4432 RepID=A0A1U8AJ23_NELNU|nr:PREDICTED: uncharacterized protein LOC104601029 [Nelumbo nucifera]